MNETKSPNTEEALCSLSDKELVQRLNRIALSIGCRMFAVETHMSDYGFIQLLSCAGPTILTIHNLEAEAERRGIIGKFIGDVSQGTQICYGNDDDNIFTINDVRFAEKKKDRCSMIYFHDHRRCGGIYKLKWYWSDVYGEKHRIKVYL